MFLSVPVGGHPLSVLTPYNPAVHNLMQISLSAKPETAANFIYHAP